jgi:hypothetical protein
MLSILKINKSYMIEETTPKRKGRKKGSTTRYCLIKDELLGKYEVHVDESNHCYMLVDADSQSTVGYYTQLPYLLKRVLKDRYVPTGPNNVYNLEEYITAMNKLANGMAKLMIPAHHNV